MDKTCSFHHHSSVFQRPKGRKSRLASSSSLQGLRAAHSENSGQAADRAAHNNLQAGAFNADVDVFTKPLPMDVTKRLETIVGSAKNLSAESRIVDVGSGTGCLIPHIQARGARDILAIDLSPKMLQELEKRYVSPGSLGNDVGVRTWCGDIIDLPDYMGPADVVFMNSMFGNIYSPEKALLRCSLVLRPGGQIVISHPMGRTWHQWLRKQTPKTVPHPLPDQESILKMTDSLPLELVQYTDDENLYISVLEVPLFYAFKSSPVYIEGFVIKGLGRGSKEMGFPTANLNPEPLQNMLTSMSTGVYFGFASLEPVPGAPVQDRDVHPMVLNFGKRPTFDDNDELSVEAHIMHNYQDNFYGKRVRLLVLGFVRPEFSFSSIQDLINRIKADIGLARSQLQTPELVMHKVDPYFNWG